MVACSIAAELGAFPIPVALRTSLQPAGSPGFFIASSWFLTTTYTPLRNSAGTPSNGQIKKEFKMTAWYTAKWEPSAQGDGR
jgi:hypothetical protein